MFIIDFDDTLFDTYAFKKARLEALKKIGISEDLYWETYKKARNSTNNIMTYSDAMHVEVLAEKGFDRKEIISILHNITSRFTDFLFPDVKEFLQSLKSFGQSMILLTHGDPGFQRFKTKGTGVSEYFDRIFITQDAKDKILEGLLREISGEDVWFINDKIEETVYLSKKFPRLKSILKVSQSFSKNDYKKSGLPYFKTLTEIKHFLEKMIS